MRPDDKLVIDGAYSMMRAATLLISYCLFSSAAFAQTTVEVSKITCAQYNLYKVVDPKLLAIWLSGYYHGKRNDTQLELQTLEERAKELRDLCFMNREINVMDAVEKLYNSSTRQ